MADKTLDTQGLNCPMPILKVKKAITEVPKGGTLEVLATDRAPSTTSRRSAMPPAIRCWNILKPMASIASSFSTRRPEPLQSLYAPCH